MRDGPILGQEEKTFQTKAQKAINENILLAYSYSEQYEKAYNVYTSLKQENMVDNSTSKIYTKLITSYYAWLNQEACEGETSVLTAPKNDSNSTQNSLVATQPKEVQKATTGNEFDIRFTPTKFKNEEYFAESDEVFLVFNLENLSKGKKHLTLYVNENEKTIPYDDSENYQAKVKLNKQRNTVSLRIRQQDQEIIRSEEYVLNYFMNAERQGKDYALLIAIEDYTNLRKLKTPQNDINALEEILKNNYGYEVDKVVNLENAQALRLTIKQFLDKVSQENVQDNQALIYLSGHGVKQDGMGYFALKSADPNDYISTAYSYANLRSLINSSQSQHTLVMIDACYSGLFFNEDSGSKAPTPVLRPIPEAEFLKTLRNKNFQQCITATAEDTEIKESYQDSGHSPFAYFFIESLKNPNLPNRFSYNNIATPLVNGIFDNGPIWSSFGKDEKGGNYFFIKK